MNFGQMHADQSFPSDNLAATRAPTATDDRNAGWSVGARWIDTSTDRGYLCVDATPGAAVWKEVGGAAAAATWAGLQGVPATFPPAPHTHPTGEVVGLQGALDGKAAAAHTHSQAEVTGLPAALTAKVDATDPRLSDARPPTAHAHPQSDVTGLTAALAGKAAAVHGHATADVTGLDTALAAKVDTGDARLTNSRAPTAHAASHAPGGTDALPVDAAAATGSLRTLGAGAQQAAAGNDARLTNARTPTAHAASHQNGGADEIATATPAANAIPKASAAGKLDGWVTPEKTALGPFVLLGSAILTTATQAKLGASGADAVPVVMAQPGTLLGVSLRASADVGAAGVTLKAEVYKNGVATGLSCTIAGSTGTEVKANATGSVAFVAGDEIDIRLTRVGTLGTLNAYAWAFAQVQ